MLVSARSLKLTGGMTSFKSVARDAIELDYQANFSCPYCTVFILLKGMHFYCMRFTNS